MSGLTIEAKNGLTVISVDAAHYEAIRIAIKILRELSDNLNANLDIPIEHIYRMISLERSPWSVLCPECGVMPLLDGEYSNQIAIAGVPWKCPYCLRTGEIIEPNDELDPEQDSLDAGGYTRPGQLDPEEDDLPF